jgi:hypothetical protein
MSNCGTLGSKGEDTLYLSEILFATLQLRSGGIELLEVKTLTCYLTNNTGRLLGLMFLT